MRTREVAALSEFLIELYKNAQHLPLNSFQHTTLLQLQKLLPFDYAAWGRGTADNRLVTDVVMVNNSAPVFPQWSQSVAMNDDCCELLLKRLNSSVMFDDIRGYRQSFAYNEHWRRHDTAHMLATITAEPADGYISFVSLCNADIARGFQDRHRQFKQLLMPHLSNALRTNRDATVQNLAEPECGVAMVDATGWVLAHCSSFMGFLKDEWGRRQHRVPTTVLPERQQAACWLGKTIHLAISPMGNNFLLRARHCSAFARLSSREAQVAELFSSGRSFRDIAQAQNVEPSTTRDQIASIYEKLGINSKDTLIRVFRDGGTRH